MNGFVSDHWKDAAVGWAILIGAAAIILGLLYLIGLALDGGEDPAPPKPTPWPTFTMPPLPNLGGTMCRDGWISHSTGRGTCSHHGGEL